MLVKTRNLIALFYDLCTGFGLKIKCIFKIQFEVTTMIRSVHYVNIVSTGRNAGIAITDGEILRFSVTVDATDYRI